MKKALGTHVLVEMFGCEPSTLTDKEYVGKALIKAAKEANAHVVASYFHQFEPFGVSGAVIIEESHFTIHTWPEHGFAAVDLFYCSEEVDAERAVRVLTKMFKPKSIITFEVKRGLLPELNDIDNGKLSHEKVELPDTVLVG